MAISGIAGNISTLLQSVGTIDTQLADLQRQLGTGQKADTFSGLGSQSSIAVGLSQQLAATSSFDDTISIVVALLKHDHEAGNDDVIFPHKFNVQQQSS